MTEPVIYPEVELGKNSQVGLFCIIGNPASENPQVTRIGEDAIIRSHTVIYSGNSIGRHFNTGHGVFIRENNRIGENVSIGTKSMVEHQVIIEDGVRIHSQVFIPEFSVLKKNCWIGPNVVFTNAPYPKSPNVKKELIGPTIEEGAIVGANSTLLPGVNIGKNSVIGAGSVVTRDVPESWVVAGNPAVKLKEKKDLPY